MYLTLLIAVNRAVNKLTEVGVLGFRELMTTLKTMYGVPVEASIF